MPTAQELAEAKQIDQELKSRGIALRINVVHPPKGQWYMRDGSPLPNLLPTDPYHRAVYLEKGWSLIPPAVPVEYKPAVLVGIAGADMLRDKEPKTVAEFVPKTLQEGPATFAELSPEEKLKETIVEPHQHRFPSRTIGSPCFYRWCTQLRVNEFQIRKVKRKPVSKKRTKGGVTIGQAPKSISASSVT
jgi:hypothetical protein